MSLIPLIRPNRRVMGYYYLLLFMHLKPYIINHWTSRAIFTFIFEASGKSLPKPERSPATNLNKIHFNKEHHSYDENLREQGLFSVEKAEKGSHPYI